MLGSYLKKYLRDWTISTHTELDREFWIFMLLAREVYRNEKQCRNSLRLGKRLSDFKSKVRLDTGGRGYLKIISKRLIMYTRVALQRQIQSV